jgi:predicted secreted protein
MTEIAAKGTLIALFNVSFITIAQVRSIVGPGMSADMIDTSHHSTLNFWRTFVAGFKSPGEVTLDLLFDPVDITHADLVGGLLGELNNGNVGSYEITFPDVANSTFTFSALVSAYEVSAPHEDALTASITLTVTGQPILA